jgi:hypothetical protein
VQSAQRLDGGGWDIDGERFDVLLVCNGHHWDPSYPSFPGSFDGPTIHSHHYIDPMEPLALPGKRVLVVGIGNSAVDIASELARKGVGEEAYPTVSSELLLRLGSGDAIAKPDVAELPSDRVRFADGTVEPVDAIVYATGYRISFPFFDPAFVSTPGNVLSLYKRMFKPEIDDLAFIGLGQAIPTIFPFAECQSKLAARWLGGNWALPTRAELEAEMRPTSDAICATMPRGHGTRCSSTITSTSTTCARAWSPPGSGAPGIARLHRRPSRPIPSRLEFTSDYDSGERRATVIRPAAGAHRAGPILL